mmetsp:Transcript_117/g.342  ORF Transcript_117/g.342 Transcript_117/m.342 type:complete len:472 (-) Transcript_117:67-1482(-)
MAEWVTLPVFGRKNEDVGREGSRLHREQQEACLAAVVDGGGGGQEGEGSARRASADRMCGRRARAPPLRAFTAAGVVLLCVLGSGVREIRGECGRNPISNTECSMEITYLRQLDDGLTPTVAGLCDNEKQTCDCSPPFKGPACDEIHTAAMPAFFSVEKSLYYEAKKTQEQRDQVASVKREEGEYSATDGRIFNSWTFLTKTCWDGGTSGTLRVQLQYDAIECQSGRSCDIVQEDWATTANLPDIVFYAHYNSQFETSVMESYFPQSDYNSGCRGEGSVYSEKLTCGEWDGSACLMDKTFQVSNTATEQTMIYIAIVGCGMRGTAMWNVSVSTPFAPEASSVCGAKGTESYMRCFSEQGGTCQLQNPTRFSTEFTPVTKISRATVAIIAVAFVSATVVGLVLIKVHQTRHKRARQRAALEQMTKAHYQRNGLGPNGTGERLQAQQGVAAPQQAMSYEAMTGHVPISGGMMH